MESGSLGIPITFTIDKKSVHDIVLDLQSADGVSADLGQGLDHGQGHRRVVVAGPVDQAEGLGFRRPVIVEVHGEDS